MYNKIAINMVIFIKWTKTEKMNTATLIVSAILVKKTSNSCLIYTQTRWKPSVSPSYSGLIEIPAGVINAYENIYEALGREIKEECGMEIVKIVGDWKSEIEMPRNQDKTFAFRPFICQQALQTNDGLPWIGFVFVCEVQGEPQLDPIEAKDPRWLSVTDLKELITLSPEKIFPVQLPVLKYFTESIENGQLKI